MSRYEKKALRPRLEYIESRCLLSVAVLEILNASVQPVSFQFRWTDSSAWTAYTETPGQDGILSTTYSTSLTPQVLYSATSASGSKTTDSLTQGYGEWSAPGAPPASDSMLYE
jgi:hypothetical protein